MFNYKIIIYCSQDTYTKWYTNEGIEVNNAAVQLVALLHPVSCYITSNDYSHHS